MLPLETVAEVDPLLAAPIETGSIPVPERPTVCGEFGALSAIVKVPAIGAAEAGMKVTEIWQFARMARLDPQVFVSEKFPAAAIDVMARAAVPEFVRVTLCATLELPWGMLPKLSVFPEREAPGTAGLMEKSCAEDMPPPGSGLVTVICAVPAVAISDAGTVAVSWVALT